MAQKMSSHIEQDSNLNIEENLETKEIIDSLGLQTPVNLEPLVDDIAGPSPGDECDEDIYWIPTVQIKVEPDIYGDDSSSSVEDIVPSVSVTVKGDSKIVGVDSIDKDNIDAGPSLMPALQFLEAMQEKLSVSNNTTISTINNYDPAQWTSKLPHPTEKVYTCSICQYKCLGQGNLKMHVVTHTEVEKPFACSMCPKKFNRNTHLVRHMVIHSGEKPHSCSSCQYRSSRKENLIIHMRTHEEVKKKFLCTVCSKVFSRNDHLKRHMLKHTGDNQFCCDICTYKSNRKENYIEHLRSHSEDRKPFPCTLCTKTFTRKTHLKRHMMTHTKIKPYYCDICEYKSTRKEYVTTHMRIHTGEKCYSCSMCDYRSSTRGNLNKHIKVHRTKGQEKHFLES